MQNLMNSINSIKPTTTKGKTIAIAFILLLTISAAAAALPHVANAQVNTYSYTPTQGANGLWNLQTFAGQLLALTPSV